MAMLLTLSQPAIKPEFSYPYQTKRNNIHDFSPRVPLTKTRFSSPRPPSRGDINRASPRLTPYSGAVSIGQSRNSTAAFDSRHSLSESFATLGSSSTSSNLSSSLDSDRSLNHNMSDRHRGLGALPLPSSMTLPDPRSNHQRYSSLSGHHGHYTTSAPSTSQVPQQSQQHHYEDPASSQTWYTFRAEEERRKQEEERTRQETLRLEQRKLEAGMLHDALTAGIPPSMIPMIYAGLGSNYLASGSGGQEWMQQLVAQFQALAASAMQQTPHALAYASSHQSMGQQHPTSHPSPPQLRHEPRAPHYQFPHPTHAQVVPSQPLDPVSQQAAYTYNPHQPPTSIPRSATHTQLPRLTTNHDPYSPPPSQGSAHPLHHGQNHGDAAAATSPNIFFHHWQPPNDAKPSESKAGNHQPPVATTRSETVANSRQTGEPRETPRKRKAQGGHQPNPPPSSAGASHTSPTFSNASLPSTSGGSRHVAGRKGSISGTHEHARTRSSVSVGPREDDDGSITAVPPPTAGTVNASTFTRPASSRKHERAHDDRALSTQQEDRPAAPRAQVSWTKFRPLQEGAEHQQQQHKNLPPAATVTNEQQASQHARPRSH